MTRVERWDSQSSVCECVCTCVFYFFCLVNVRLISVLCLSVLIYWCVDRVGHTTPVIGSAGPPYCSFSRAVLRPYAECNFVCCVNDLFPCMLIQLDVLAVLIVCYIVLTCSEDTQ